MRSLTAPPASVRRLCDASSCALRKAITQPMWCARNGEMTISCSTASYASMLMCSSTSAGSFVRFHCSTKSCTKYSPRSLAQSSAAANRVARLQHQLDSARLWH